MKITHHYSTVLLNPVRLRIASKGGIVAGHTKWAALSKEADRVENIDGNVFGHMYVDTPFVCEGEFVEGVDGQVINLYEHQVTEYKDASQYIYILSLELCSVDKPMKRMSNQTKTSIFKSTPVGPKVAPALLPTF